MAGPDTHLVSADMLDVSKFSAWGAAVAAMTSGVVAVVSKLTAALPMPIVGALIGFAAVCLVVMAAVVITDMLIRRDLAKNVMPMRGDQPAVPVTYQIWKEFWPELVKAAPSIEAIARHLLGASPEQVQDLWDEVGKATVRLESHADGNGKPPRVWEASFAKPS